MTDVYNSDQLKGSTKDLNSTEFVLMNSLIREFFRGIFMLKSYWKSFMFSNCLNCLKILKFIFAMLELLNFTWPRLRSFISLERRSPDALYTYILYISVFI